MTKLEKAEAALAAHVASNCERCTYSVTAFGPVCEELKALAKAIPDPLPRLRGRA